MYLCFDNIPDLTFNLLYSSAEHVQTEFSNYSYYDLVGIHKLSQWICLCMYVVFVNRTNCRLVPSTLLTRSCIHMLNHVLALHFL